MNPTSATTPRAVDLDRVDWSDTEALIAQYSRDGGVVIGVAEHPVPDHGRALLESLTLTLAPQAPGRSWVPRAEADPDALLSAARARPIASAILADLLRMSDGLPTYDALFAESLAYSTLLGGEEFQRWRREHPPRSPGGEPDRPRVLVDRAGDTLTIRLNRPERRNAYDRHLRDALHEALLLPLLDESIAHIELAGEGPDFCSGGDLDEFGSFVTVADAHRVRLERSSARLIDRLRAKVTAHLHGACVGSGIELPAFAGRLEATADAWFRLPELSMGLIPGAGGTVSISRRIGRWRTAYLVLTGYRLDAATARDWGLVDALV